MAAKPPKGMTNGVLLGVVLGPHGLKGEVKVKTFTEIPEALGEYGPLHLADGREFVVDELRAGTKGEALVTFKGLSGRNAAESLKGEKLFVPREALPEPEDDEFYLNDLVGLKTEARDGTALGHVLTVHDFGGGPLLEIEAADGKTRYLPFTKAVVPVVDIAGGRLVVAPPDEI